MRKTLVKDCSCPLCELWHTWSQVVTGKSEVFTLENRVLGLDICFIQLLYHVTGSKAFISQVNLCHLLSSLARWFLDGS